MNTNPTLQDRAVEAAARFLEIRGYETLATGWKSPEARGTIDLVARDPESDDLVFVDVSARPNSGAGFGDGRNDRETMELLAVSWLYSSIKKSTFRSAGFRHFAGKRRRTSHPSLPISRASAPRPSSCSGR